MGRRRCAPGRLHRYAKGYLVSWSTMNTCVFLSGPPRSRSHIPTGYGPRPSTISLRILLLSIDCSSLIPRPERTRSSSLHQQLAAGNLRAEAPRRPARPEYATRAATPVQELFGEHGNPAPEPRDIFQLPATPTRRPSSSMCYYL